MPSLPGKRLGPYEILAAVGAGGMGEVYRARDTRLDRTVAIKVLPAHLADDPGRRERFEREARTIAGLNHPHICVLYDIGRQDGIDFLVMEYLEGETMATRLLKGPLPLDQVLQFASEISDALDKAHRKGVTHRDLKPGNIMVTKSGTKLLDFGLAKLRQEVAPTVRFSELPTAQDAITEEGALLGTLQYMSPEQVEGREVDARTDIFAFGAVVYEMATGEKCFAGRSQASVIGAIMKDEPPPISSLQPMTPPALDRVVKKCLAKEREDRWQSAKDLTDELKWIIEGSTHLSPVPAAGAQGTSAVRPRPLAFALAALVLGALISGVAIWNLKPASAPPASLVTRAVINLPPGQWLPLKPDLPLGLLALSPDGSHLAYIGADRTDSWRLYLRAMDSADAKPISGTEGAFSPFFSSDGQWLHFFQRGMLKKISVNGGAAVTLGPAGQQTGGTWGDHGAIIFGGPYGLQQISDRGGSPQLLTHLENGEPSHSWPEVLPSGKAVVFDTGGEVSGDASQIVAYSISARQRRNLGLLGTYPRYAPSGHLLYMQGSTLIAVPFDAQRLEIKGSGVPVAEGVLQFVDGAGQYSVSATGTLVYISGTAGGIERSLVWVSRNGSEQALAAPPRAYGFLRLSPDGRRVVLEVEDQIWTYDLVRDTLTRLTFEGSVNQEPAWTPDGKRIAFRSNKEGTNNLFWMLADGSGGMERLNSGKYTQILSSFSPDGKLLAFHELNPSTQRDIWVLHLGDHKAEPFLRTQFNEGAATFSPDGRWLAYVSDESSHPEIYVQPYPGPGGKWQISTDGGTEPVWNRNGRELFYRSGNKMMSVEVTTQPTFSAGKPKMLFEGQYFTVHFPLIGVAYDVSGDGQKFLMVKEGQQAQAATQINVVQNWFEELKRRVPAGSK